MSRTFIHYLLFFYFGIAFSAGAQAVSDFGTLQALIKEREKVSIFTDSVTLNRIAVPDSVIHGTIEDILNFMDNQSGIKHMYYNPRIVLLYSDVIQKRTINRSVGNQKYMVSGYLIDASTGNPISGGTVIVSEAELLVNADSEGFFKLSLPAGVFSIKAIGPGTITTNMELNVNSNVSLNIELFEKTVELEEVIISTTNPDVNVVNLQPGSLTLEISDLKKIPAFLGEIDISRAVIALPGVSTVGEGATGFNVRGGSIDQNLILMDGIPLFNSSHLLGFFSAFNPDLVRDFTLYKGLIPSDMGGRISSVLQVNQKGPNKESLGLSTSIGPLNSKLFLNIPLKKEVSGVVLGVRGAYPNYVLSSFPDESTVSDSRASYYDVTFKYDHEFKGGSALSANIYVSQDEFNLSQDTTFRYASILAGLKYSSSISNNISMFLETSYSRYRAGINDKTINQQSEFRNGISQTSVKGMFQFSGDRTNHKLGVEANFYQFFTGQINPSNPSSEVEPDQLPDRKAIDMSMFLNTEHRISQQVGIQAGIRATTFFNVGPDQFLEFEDGLGREPGTITDTTNLASGSLQHVNTSFEPRLSINYQLSPRSSVKAGYSRTFQYIHLFSNTVASLPTDLWRPSDSNLAPVSAHIVSLGYFRNFRENLFETSLELFYKDISNTIDFISGTRILLNNELIFQTLQGDAEAYGLELLVSKTRGKFTGRLGYTFSRAWSRFQSDIENANLNQGERFPANFDRPHDLNLFGSWRLGRLWNVSANFAYTTGRPVSLPETSFRFGGAIVFAEIERNAFRVPDFHRLDLAVTLEGSNKKNRKFATSWTFSVYNVYGRKNVFSVFINGEDGRPRQLSVLGAPFPSLTFNLKMN